MFVAALGHVLRRRIRIAASIARATAAPPGRRCSSRTTTSARSTSPSTPSTRTSIYASLWNTRRPPWSIYPPSYGPGGGLYKSVDGGEVWHPLTNGLPSEGLGRIGIAVAPTDTKPRLRDRGRQGRRPLSLRRCGRRLDEDLGRRAHLGARLVLLQGRRRSEEPGHRLRVEYRPSTGRPTPAARGRRSRRAGRRRLPPALDRAGRSEPHDSRRAIRARSSASTARRRGAPGTTSRRRSSITWPPTTASRTGLTGAQQDSGAVGTPTRSGHAEISDARLERPVRRRRERLHGARSAPSDDPLRRHRRRAATSSPARRRTCRPSTTCRRRRGIPGRCRSCSRRPIRTRSTSATSSSSRRPTAAHTGRASATTSRARIPASRRISIAATAADAPEGKRRGVIYTIAPSPVRAPLIWVGTDDGLIKVTADDGKTWRNVTPPELTAWSKVVMIDASHTDANEAYAAVDRHRLDDNEPHIYRTRDAGKSWQAITKGLPAGVYVQTVKEDPHAERTAVRRHRARRVRVVRRRRRVAVAAAQPAAGVGARPRVPRRRSDRGDARSRLLGPRRHQRAAGN